jgi:hypothetical protein
VFLHSLDSDSSNDTGQQSRSIAALYRSSIRQT